MPTVLAILAEGFEEIEAVTPIDVLRRAGVSVTIAALADSLHATGRSGLTMHADTQLAAVAARDFDCIFLPGGPGTKRLRADPRVGELLRRQNAAGRWIAALCAAPTVLNDAGLLQGRRYTAHFSVADELPAILAAERTVAALGGALERLANEADASSGRVALGFLHTLGGETVPQLLKDFRAQHALVRFALVQDSAHGLLARLRDGEIDLCLTAPLPRSPDVQTQSLYEQRIDLFVPAGHRLAARHRDGLPLAEAADEDFIVMEPGYGLRTITDDLCRAAGFEPRITFEGEEADTARGLVGAGLGVSLLPATTSSLADPAVAAIRITAPKAARTVGIAWPEARPLTAPAAVFRDFALTRAAHLPH